MIHNRCYDDTQLTAKWPAEVKGLVPGFLSNAHFQGHCILRDFKKLQKHNTSMKKLQKTQDEYKYCTAQFLFYFLLHFHK